MSEVNLVKIVKDVGKILNKAGIKYVLVGGIACVLYGVKRLTVDIDIIIEKTNIDNLKKLYNLIKEIGFNLSMRDIKSALDEDGHFTILLGGVYRIDFKFPSTYLDYESLRNYNIINLESEKIYIAGIEENIAAKIKLLKSIKDLEDAIVLLELYKDRIDWNKISKYLGGEDPIERINMILDEIQTLFRENESVLERLKDIRESLSDLRK